MNKDIDKNIKNNKSININNNLLEIYNYDIELDDNICFRNI